MSLKSLQVPLPMISTFSENPFQEKSRNDLSVVEQEVMNSPHIPISKRIKQENARRRLFHDDITIENSNRNEPLTMELPSPSENIFNTLETNWDYYVQVIENIQNG